MALIKSISGIRGTIGGLPQEGLTPYDVVSLVAAFSVFLKNKKSGARLTVVIGRDGRQSGAMLSRLVSGTLISLGIDVIDMDLASSPSVEMAVIQLEAQGGIIITASHNPAGWNALKLLDERGEIISAASGEEVYRLALTDKLTFSTEQELGNVYHRPELSEGHLLAVLRAVLVDKEAIAARRFKVVVDGINSVGGIIIPELLRRLGVTDIIEVNCEPSGNFSHNPEPLASNLVETANLVKETGADLGIVVDPDVDRLAFIDERGIMISEEYTIVAVTDYVLTNFEDVEKAYPGKYLKTACSNLSSTRALKDVVEKHGGRYEAAAVGEVNVASKMKEIKAFIGGEGNGGVIYSELHYGRDALIGLALYLSALARSGQTISEFQSAFPRYSMVKEKIDLQPGLDLGHILKLIKEEEHKRNDQIKTTEIDGLKFDWQNSWVHLRASNTEPIIRIYAEAEDEAAARLLSEDIKAKIYAYIK